MKKRFLMFVFFLIFGFVSVLPSLSVKMQNQENFVISIAELEDSGQKKLFAVQYDPFSLFEYVGSEDKFGNRIVMFNGKYGVADSTGYTIVACVHDSLYWSDVYNLYVGYISMFNLMQYYTVSGMEVSVLTNNSYNSNPYSSNVRQTCSDCKGTGKSRFNIYYPPKYNGKTVYMDDKCSICGRWESHVHRSCSRCNGTGKI